MRVRFVAHAGVLIAHGKTRIAIDPWFFGSHFQNPILPGLAPKQRTIDFQVHPAIDDIFKLRLDAVFCSHLHTHHSPLTEIQILAAQSEAEDFTIGVPKLLPGGAKEIKENLGSVSNRVKIGEFSPGQTWEKNGLRVTARESSSRGHLTWHAESNSGSLIHIADGMINADVSSRQIGESWKSLENIRPDILMITAGGTNTLVNKPEGRTVIENSTMSPPEAARLANFIQPRIACPIGFYNFSIWCNRQETTLPYGFAEEQFQWALSYLAPKIRPVILRPGTEFLIKAKNGTSRRRISIRRRN